MRSGTCTAPVVCSACVLTLGLHDNACMDVSVSARCMTCVCVCQCLCCRCGNIAAILELDEHLNKNFKVNWGAGDPLHVVSQLACMPPPL
jgi:hypothetical protein